MAGAEKFNPSLTKLNPKRITKTYREEPLPPQIKISCFGFTFTAASFYLTAPL